MNLQYNCTENRSISSALKLCLRKNVSKLFLRKNVSNLKKVSPICRLLALSQEPERSSSLSRASEVRFNCCFIAKFFVLKLSLTHPVFFLNLRRIPIVEF